MKLNLQNTALTLTVGNADRFPDGRRPQIVFSGRSNVGKSSLINTLLLRKALARVSSSPGKTVTLNFYDVDGKLYFVDIPGYGYAGVSPQEKSRWSELTDAFLHSSCDRRLILQLIDLKVGPTADDRMMLDWLAAMEQPYAVAATKADKLNKTDFAAALAALREALPSGVPLVPFSAKTGMGREELWKILYSFLDGGKASL